MPNVILQDDAEKHTVYKERWHVLLTVASLNIGINTLLYSYSPVAVDAAQYFEKEPDDINNFTTIGLVCSLIVSLAATWLVEHIGLRYSRQL